MRWALPVFILITVLLCPVPTFALETGVQIPDASALPRLESAPFKFSWVKFQYSWRDAKDQPVEDWAKAAKQQGYKVLVSVAKKPASVPQGEAGYAQFQAFMQDLSSRLGSSVDAYEIWNEPNLKDEWRDWGEINPQEYMKLLRAGVLGVRAGNLQAKTISAALAPLSGDYDDIRYFNEMMSAGLTNIAGLDGIGWHSNVVSNIPPENSTLEGFQRVKTALKTSKPVWITEFGWDRNRAGIDSPTQIKYIQDAFKTGENLGVETMIVWNFGFGKLNPEFASWDIETQESSNRLPRSPRLRQVEAGCARNDNCESRVNDTSESGCKGLTSHECAIKKRDIASLPEAIAKDSSLDVKEKSKITSFFDEILAFFGFRISSPATLSPRSDDTINSKIPPSAQSQDQNPKIRTGENLGNNSSEPKLDDGVGLYQYALPKEIQDSLDKPLSFECLHETSIYPNGITPITKGDCQK